jgi:hypothetical protein
MTKEQGRTVEVTARTGDQIPEGANIHTHEGALALVRWAAPSLTETEAEAVRDYLFDHRAPTTPEAFACAIRVVLGPDVTVKP